MSKIIIAGSRDGNFNILDVYKAINKSGFKISEIVSGTARGVDQLGELYFKINSLNLINFPDVINSINLSRYPADWNKYGKKAGYLRNKEMGLYADGLIALWDGKSKGTMHMINIMKELNKPIYIYNGDNKNASAN